MEYARTALAGQEEKIREFKDQHLGDLPGQVTSNLQILGGLQSQLQSEEDALNRAKQQNVYLESLLGQYRSVQRSSKSGDAPMGLPAIDQELERLRAQLADLSSHYTDRHPDVRKLKEQIAKTEKMKQQITADLQTKAAGLPAAGAVAQSDADIQDTAPMAEMQSQLKANQIEITNRQHAIEELKTRIADYQGRLNRSPVREQELTDLTRGYDQSRANYDALLKKKNDSELATSLELRQQGEHFRILDPPSLPVKPYSPNRMKLCGIGLFVGLVLGVVISVGAEKMDDRLYSEKDLKTLVPAAVISEIPGIITPGEENHQQRKLRLGWAATGLLLATIAVGCVFSFLRG